MRSPSTRNPRLAATVQGPGRPSSAASAATWRPARSTRPRAGSIWRCQSMRDVHSKINAYPGSWAWGRPFSLGQVRQTIQRACVPDLCGPILTADLHGCDASWPVLAIESHPIPPALVPPGTQGRLVPGLERSAEALRARRRTRRAPRGTGDGSRGRSGPRGRLRHRPRGSRRDKHRRRAAPGPGRRATPGPRPRRGAGGSSARNGRHASSDRARRHGIRELTRSLVPARGGREVFARVGVKTQTRPSNRSARACATPDRSEPAIGWAATNFARDMDRPRPPRRSSAWCSLRR